MQCNDAMKGAAMILFATPDFGAGGGVICILVLIWAFVLVFALAGVIWGGRVFAKGSLKGCVIILVSGSVPLACCIGPPLTFRVAHGSFPLSGYPSGKIEKGMTAEEVTAILGEPHRRTKRDDRETWTYCLDSFCVGDFFVDFGVDGRVTSTYGH
jgi:SmpA / OmlA family